MRSRSKHDDDLAVSEVIGVVMLLAMVVTMMGGVFVFLTPYVNDFQDNTAWSNANGIAERLDGRIDVVAGASIDTGLRTTIHTTTSAISPLIGAEVWTVAADLTNSEVVTVTYLNQTSFSVFAQNETANRALIWTQSEQQVVNFSASNEAVIIEHAINVAGQSKANPLAMIMSFAMMLKYSFDMHFEMDCANFVKFHNRNGDII